MKPKYSPLFLIAVAVAFPASAADLTWDITPGTVGPGDSQVTGGAGTWDMANGNWTSDAGVTNVAWNNATPDNAIFGDTAGVVTLGTAITAGTITVNTAGYAIDTNGNALNASVLAGGGNLTKQGLGAFTLAGTNTYTGALTINGGSVVLNNTAFTGAQSAFGAGGALALGSGGTLRVTVAGAGLDATGYALSRNLTGAGALQFDNAGATGGREITLSGTNTGFAGTMAITRSAGTSAMRVKANRMGDATQISVGDGTQFWDNTGSGTVGYTFTSLAGTGEGGFGALRVGGGVTYSGNITVAAGGGRIGGAGGAGVISTITGQIGGGPLELLGSSNGITLVLRNNLNSQSSTTIVSGSTGVVRAGANGVFGTGTLTQNGAGLSSDSITARTFANAYVLGGNVALGDTVNNGKLTFSGGVSLGGVARTVTANSDVSFNGGLISGAGNLGLTSVGSGRLILDGTSAGNTVILNRTATVGGVGSLDIGGTVTAPGLNTSGGGGTGGVSNTAVVNVLAGATLNMTGGAIVGQNTLLHDGILNVAGTYNQTAGGLLIGNNQVSATGTINVNNGGRFIFTSTGEFTVGRDTGVGTFNVNTGGTLEVSKTVQGDTGVGIGGNSSAATASIFNFNGGTFKALSANASIAGMTSATISSAGGTVDTNNFNITIGQSMTGLGGLTKIGGGKLTLSGNSAYSGATLVNNGTLAVNGNISTSAFTVNNGGTVAGTGTIGALTVTTGGTVGPGNSAGVLNTGDFGLQAGGTMAVELTGLAVGTGYDQLNVAGLVNLGGALALTASFTPAEGSLFFILANDGADAITGTFSGLANNAIFTNGGQAYQISYFADSTGNTFTGGNDVALMLVPEPSVALIGGLGLLALLRRRRA